MKGYGLRFRHTWLLPVGVVALIAAHATILRDVLSYTGLSAALVSGVIILVVIKHLGLLGSLLAVFRRQSRR